MEEFFGIVLLDGSEIVLKIYTISTKKWQLVHALNHDLLDYKREKQITPYTIAEAIADLLSASYTQKVIEWRICGRNIAKKTTSEVALALGIKIEYLDRKREQELLCKGMFTETW